MAASPKPECKMRGLDESHRSELWLPQRTAILLLELFCLFLFSLMVSLAHSAGLRWAALERMCERASEINSQPRDPRPRQWYVSPYWTQKIGTVLGKTRGGPLVTKYIYPTPTAHWLGGIGAGFDLVRPAGGVSGSLALLATSK